MGNGKNTINEKSEHNSTNENVRSDIHKAPLKLWRDPTVEVAYKGMHVANCRVTLSDNRIANARAACLCFAIYVAGDHASSMFVGAAGPFRTGRIVCPV